jgi:hypothetical protein
MSEIRIDEALKVRDILKMVAEHKIDLDDVICVYAKQPKPSEYEVWRMFKRVAVSGEGLLILEHDKEYQTRLDDEDD